ncbi:protein FAM149A [Xenopus laevis]|uniref:Protein FAM149A n=1 Tax=Xenopus laevis TaxID=8355 RepID=A0A8J0U765_XENLA|nr:protein FAM149A [Xenopus laevis]
MKVAVLDLGTIFAKIFKSSVSPVNPGPSSSPFSQGSASGNTNGSLAQKASFLLLPAPPSPRNLLSSLTSSSSSLPRVPSGKALATHLTGYSTPNSPSHATKPHAANLGVSSFGASTQQANEESGLGSQTTVTSPTPPNTILVRAAPSNANVVMPAMQLNHPSRSPWLHRDVSASGWNTKSMLFNLPDIGEESTDYKESHHSQGKGITRGSAERYISDNVRDSLPEHFTKPVQEAIHHFKCESISSLSSSGQTTPTDLNQSWSGIQSCTTGLSTERSSVYSWTDDEFDKANTQRMHQLFWDVDEMLFEGNVTSQNKTLQAEGKEWTERSLHLRILGKQLILPKDEGFQHFQSRAPSNAYIHPVADLGESSSYMKELCVSGSKLVPTTSPLHKAQDSASNGGLGISELSSYSFLKEEIYGMDGTVEEYLAFDSREHDEEGLDQKKVHLQRKRNKRGIPPVSPNACIKDTVAAEIFDDAWRKAVDYLQELIARFWDEALEELKQTEKRQSNSNRYLPIPVAHIISESASIPPSRGSEARSLSFGSYLFPSQTNRNLNSDLNGVMTIQAKPLQHRHAGSAEKMQNEQEDKSFNIAPQVLSSARNRLGRLGDNSVLSSSRILQTPSRKTQRRLPSITLDPLRSKTPNVYSDEVLRGTKLYTGLDRLPSPSLQIIRNKLPPINSEVAEQHLSVPGSRHSANKTRLPLSRVSSAVPDSAGLRPPRERTAPQEQFTRPNTTHTFRLELSHRRSFTPMDFTNHTWTGQAFLTSSQYQPKAFQRNQPTSRRKSQVAS